MAVGVTNYIYKFLIALGLTPLLYLAHYGIDFYMGKAQAEELTEAAGRESGKILF